VEAAFRGAGGRRAAAGLRGAGDEYFKRRLRAHCACYPFSGGKDLRRNRLRVGADILPHDCIAGSYCRDSRTRDALVADDFHRDDCSPYFIATDHRILALLMGLCLPRVRVALMPRKTRRAIAHHVAMEQFTSRGIARNKDRSGILIFVSLAERYARIIADDEIAARVPQSEWQAAVDALVAHMRDGRIADGFITAINDCGIKLAKHFPRTTTSGNVRPNRIYLI
jgi:hypothetical protein